MFMSSVNPLLAFYPWMALFTPPTEGTPAPTAPTKPRLSHSEWALSGVDCDGTDWSGSKITFVSQRPLDGTGTRFSISGVIDWRSNLGEEARELFLGHLEGDHLRMEGFELRTQSADFVLGTYEANLDAAAGHLHSGRWIGDNNAADTERWEAICVSHEPAPALPADASTGRESADVIPLFPRINGDTDAFSFELTIWQLGLSLPVSMLAVSALMFEQSRQMWLSMITEFPGHVHL